MAREAYRSLYGDLTKLKDDSVLKDPAAGPDDDDELFELLLAVSDWVDQYCNRHFYPRVETLLFDGSGGDRLVVPDLIAVGELAQIDPSGEFPGSVWSAGAYRLLPHNAAPLRPWGRPYGAILSLAEDRARPERGGGFPPGEANFRVSGVWGYRFFAEPSGAALSADADAGDSTVAVSDGSRFRVGQTGRPERHGRRGCRTGSGHRHRRREAERLAGAERRRGLEASFGRRRGHPALAGVGGAGGSDPGGPNLDPRRRLRAFLRGRRCGYRRETAAGALSQTRWSVIFPDASE